MEELWSNQALRLFAVCYLILALKMLALGSYTSILRIRRKVYSTPEDYSFQGIEPSSAGDEEVERVRRAHQNDIENILPFFGIGLFYALTQPSMLGAQICFVGFTLARLFHSLFYVWALQPHRTLVYGVGYVLLLWMLGAGLVSVASM